MKCVGIVAIQMAVCQTRSVGALLERRPGRGPHVSHSGTPPVVELVVGLVDIGAHVEVPGMGGRQPVSKGFQVWSLTKILGQESVLGQNFGPK